MGGPSRTGQACTYASEAGSDRDHNQVREAARRRPALPMIRPSAHGSNLKLRDHGSTLRLPGTHWQPGSESDAFNGGVTTTISYQVAPRTSLVRAQLAEASWQPETERVSPG